MIIGEQYVKMVSTPPLKEIVLSGGGTNGIAIVGALQALYEKKKFDTIERWIGSSAGAIISLFMVVGYSPQSLYKLLLKLNYTDLNDANGDSVLSFFDTMGVMNGSHFVKIVKLALTKKGFFEDITFCELRAKTKKDLVIAGYNITRGVTESFSASKTPYMKVVLACRISMSVPFLFRPITHNGQMYIDGCTIDHTPIQFAKHKKNTLIIQCLKNTHPSHTVSEESVPTDVMEFCTLLNTRVFQQLHKHCMRHTIKKNPHTIMSILLPKSNSTTFVVDFSMKIAEKETLFLLGHETALRHPMMHQKTDTQIK